LKTPGFTITGVLTLALGIGVTTSIFTLVHAVLLESLPVANPNQLYRIGKDPHCCVNIGFVQSGEWGLVSNALYNYLRDNTGGFEELAAFDAPGVFLGIRREHSASPAESHLGEFVSGNYFATFGVNASSGRVLSKLDDEPSAPPAAVMSYRLWAQKYGLDRSVIGATFNINDKPFTLVGVTPPNFYGARLTSAPPDFYLPLATEPLVKGESSILNKADTHWLNVIGRIRPKTNIALVEAKMRVELRQWLESHRSEMSADERTAISKQTLNLGPGGAGITSMRQQYGDSLWILLTISGFVLLIACANVANLMLVRTMERREQISLSVALGAHVSRIVRAAVTECVVLSLIGGGAGLDCLCGHAPHITLCIRSTSRPYQGDAVRFGVSLRFCA
jgi:predicted permease